jgi:hypothetical protein
MPIQALLPYALAAYGGYQGYRGAKDAGASGLGRILGGITGAYTGYNLGAMVPGTVPYSQLGQNFASLKGLPGQQIAKVPFLGGDPGTMAGLVGNEGEGKSASSLLNILKRQRADGTGMEYSPGKVSAAIAAGTYLSGAFDPQPTDIYTPGYNMGYLDLRANRPGYTYIDPTTGEEKAYEKVYAPEEAGIGDPRMGSYSMNVQRLNTGGIAQIQKFNEGGVNYLPSKVSHDENDANNYVRASGYVEDGSGNGDKDEDTMLAQLADGEFVTRADGVLGAGIIAGANPNSMKDMREKGAKYFYEQQAKYKRVFDLLKEKNGDSEQKTN